MKSALLIARSLYSTGQDSYGSLFVLNPAAAKEGWRKMQLARRICRKLGWKPEAVLP